MNRIEFIAELERLLQDISAEERNEAVQYYRDYFEDAGMENEQHIIEELGSPKKVADTIKAGLRGGCDESSEYRETGYTDTRFEDKKMPARREEVAYETEKDPQKKKPYTNNALKILLIIAILVVGAPVILPLAVAVIAIVLALGVGVIALAGGIVITAIVVLIIGVIMAFAGIIKIFSFPALGLAVCGAGLILGVLGLLATVLLVKLCMIVFPIVFRGIVELCRKLIHKKGEQAR